MDLIYTVLYTHQKTKKAKTWQDGTLKLLATGTKAVLCDDKGSKLDVLHIHASDVVTGEQLESDRYYIQVEEIQKRLSPQAANTLVNSSGSPQSSYHSMIKPKADQFQARDACALQNAGLRIESSGMKRKRSGFIPPRVVRPRTAEHEMLSIDTLQPVVTSACVPNNGPYSHSICATSSLPNDSSCEREPPSSLFLGGGTRTQAPKSQDSFRSLGSHHYKSQPCVTKSSPWRTVGLHLSKSSPVPHSVSLGQTVETEGRGQSLSRDMKSLWNEDTPEETSVAPCLLSSPQFVHQTQKAAKPLLGNCVLSGLKAPLAKRSASEIMALLGKKKHEVVLENTPNTLSSTENLAVVQHFDEHVLETDQKPLSAMSDKQEQFCSDNIYRFEEVESQNTSTMANLQDSITLQKSSPNIVHQFAKLKASLPCLTAETSAEGSNIVSDSSYASQNVIGSSTASQNVIGSSTASQNVIGSSTASQNVIGSSTASQNVIGSSTASQNVIGSSTASHNVSGSSSASHIVNGSFAASQIVDGSSTASQNVIGSSSASHNSESVHGSSAASQNSESVPKLSASSLSLSKQDFEMAECSDGESVSSKSATVRCADSSEDRHSQNVCEFDFSQSNHEIGLKDEEKGRSLDCMSDLIDDSVEVIQKQCGNMTYESAEVDLSCNTEQNLQLKNENNHRDLHIERSFENGRFLQSKSEIHALTNDVAQSSETVEDDLHVCFEMSFSPLSGVSDSDGESSPEHSGEKVCSGETPVSQQRRDSDGQQAIGVNHIALIQTTSASGDLLVEQSDLEKTLDPRDKYCHRLSTHLVDCLELPHNTDRARVEAADPPDSSLLDEEGANETRTGVSTSQLTAQQKGMESELQTMENSSVSKPENVKTGQPLQKEQDTFPDTVPGNAVYMKSVNSSSNIADPWRTVNDLHLTPDSFVASQSSHTFFEAPACVFMPTMQLSHGDCEKEQNEKDTQSSCDTCMADDKHNSHWSQSHHDVGWLKTGITVEHFQEQLEVDAVTVSSATPSSSFSAYVGSELSTPSPTLSCVTVATDNKRPLLTHAVQQSTFTTDNKWPLLTHAVQQSTFTIDKDDQDSLTAKPEMESAKNKIAKSVNPSYNRQEIRASPQNNLYYNNNHRQFKDSPLSLAHSPPVHRLFQTVAEVLGERDTGAQMPTSYAVCKDPAAVFQKNKMEIKSQPDEWVESLTSEDADSEPTKRMVQSASPCLPHPDRLTRGPTQEVASHGHFSATTSTDIAEAISVRLTDYKMQGMVASDLVRRPTTYRHDTRPSHDPPPWPTHNTLTARTETTWDLSSGPVSPDRSVEHSSWLSEKPGLQLQTSGSARPPESRLFSPADMQSLLKMTSLSSQHQGSSSCNMNLTQFSDNLHRHSLMPGAVDWGYHSLDHQNAAQLCDHRVGEAGGQSKGKSIMENNVFEENACVISVGTDLGTALGPKSVCEPASNIPEAREDSSMSPVLFSQCVQSQRLAVSVSCTQRNRKWIPMVTAPDELSTKEALSSESEAKDRISLKDKGCIRTISPSKQEISISTHSATNIHSYSALHTEKRDSMTSVDNVHPPASCGKDVEDTLVDSHMDNLDFSGFTDSFPESGQELDADNMATAGACISQYEEETNVVNAEAGEQQKDLDTKFDSVARSVFSPSESLRRHTQVHKASQSSSVEDLCTSSTASSPGFIIANSGLDCDEEMIEESSNAIHRDQPEVFLTEQEYSSLDNTQKQNRVSKFASQFRTLHPYMHSLEKENQSRTNPRKMNMKSLMAIKPAYNCQKPFDIVSASGDNVLAPSAPTDSPPIDISPVRSVEKSSVWDTDTYSGQCQTFQQAPSSAHCSPNGSFINPDHLRNRHPASYTGLGTKRLVKPGVYSAASPEQTLQMNCTDCSSPSGGSSVSQCVMKGTVQGNVATSRAVGLGKFRRPGVATVGGCLPTSQFQSSLCHEVQFCSREEVESQATPMRQVVIPPSFQSVAAYKQVLTAALTEFINLQLFTVAKTYHCALSKVDLSAYIEGVGAKGRLAGGSTNPACQCGSVSKVVQVKKEGPNKGRFFYACSAPRDKQCKFFQWVDQQSGSSTSRGGGGSTSMIQPKFSDPASIMGYLRGQGLMVYCQCRFVHRAEDHKFGFPKWVRPQQSDSVQKKSLFIKLPQKDSAATHAKDDLWVISKSLSFGKGETFVAHSTFHGPNSHAEVAVDPVAGYSASVWTDGSVCHAIHCGNAATELTCMANIQDHVDMTSLPVLPHLLGYEGGGGASCRVSKGFKAPTARQAPSRLYIPPHFVRSLAEDLIIKHRLNTDQAQAVRQAASMMDKEADPASSLLLIHGVFGAGKSYLLSVLILFLVEVFQCNDTYCPGVPFPWKLLLSSTTNVAVDRVLQGLLELGFDDFVRVGSMKKIAKPVLPYSMHASGSNTQELKDLQEMLKSQNVTAAEKHCIRRSIERHKLGENRKRLGAVRVVGVTCAASSFQCLDKMQFPFVVLDECSQMTEPASLLPIARFSCEKLVLVGDPKQLDPTLQGSEAAHGEGLEQTLFDRLMKMGYGRVMLRTQYRCHPAISAVSNALFYHGQLLDGVSAEHRQPLVELFPTMCFYDVSSGKEVTNSGGSFTNEAEAQFVALLLSVLMLHGLPPSSVGVVTLYKAQARRIVEIIQQSQGGAQCETTGVQVSTVDAFQGGERDVIILSCVRTRSVGFIDSDKRMNVALSRARHHMLIVGHRRNLQQNKRWAQVIAHCQAMTGGVVMANTAGRQLQAVVDQAGEDQHRSMSSGPSAEGQCQVQQSAARKRKSASLKGGTAVKDSSCPPVSEASSPAYTVQPVARTDPSSSQVETAVVCKMAVEAESAVPGNRGESRGSSSKMKRSCSKAGSSRIKPIVIEEEVDEAVDLSDDDDFLPDGLI